MMKLSKKDFLKRKNPFIKMSFLLALDGVLRQIIL